MIKKGKMVLFKYHILIRLDLIENPSIFGKNMLNRI